LKALLSSKTEMEHLGASSPSHSNQDASTGRGDSDGMGQTNPDEHQNGGASADVSSSPTRELPFQGYNTFSAYNGEMGQAQVQDISTFPPTFAPQPEVNNSEYSNIFSMDNILGDGFWDSVLIPGFSNNFEGLSNGFVYGAGGSGFITPKRTSPAVSGANSPLRVSNGGQYPAAHINAAFGA